MKKLSIVILAVLFAAGSMMAQQSDMKDSKPRTVSVRGMGTINTSPDQVRLSIQVNTRSESATGAMAQANSKTREILSLLKNFGIEVKDVQTSRVTVSPILDYQKNIQPPPILGYTGTNEFSVIFKGKLMENVGEFMDKAITAGATNFGGLLYEASKQRELERGALKKAAVDAQARGEVLAKELGSTVGKVLSISESLSTPNPMVRGAIMADAMASPGAPIMTGELTISATVDVVFELK
jgi:uncharacterized protein YggE